MTRKTTKISQKKAGAPRRRSRNQSKTTARRPAAAKERRASSKKATVLAALQQPTGATLTDLMTLTGWQAHSVRGFLSGTVRKRLGLTLTSEASPEGRRYRIATEDPAAQPS